MAAPPSPFVGLFQALGRIAESREAQSAPPAKRPKPGSSPLSGCTPCATQARIERANQFAGIEPRPKPRRKPMKAAVKRG